MVAIILASKGRITNAFGTYQPNAAVKYHKGVDTGWGNGTDIYAPADGHLVGYHRSQTIKFKIGTYGRYVRITHDDGTQSLIAHLASIDVPDGRVRQGQRIATMGNTGTYDRHCHQEYIVGGVQVDPLNYLTGGTAGGNTSPLEPQNNARKDDLMRIYSNSDENGLCYFFTPTDWQVVSDPTEATHLSLMLHGTNAAPKVNGYQINWLKKRVDQARAKFTVNPTPIVDAVKAAIAAQGVTVDFGPLESRIREEFAKVNANIDDQPTTFKVIPG